MAIKHKIKKELFTPNFQKIKEKSVYSSGQQMGQALSSGHKKNLSEERFFWCSKVDELLNSIVDESSDINGWKNGG